MTNPIPAGKSVRGSGSRDRSLTGVPVLKKNLFSVDVL